ncbi:MAG: late competence development ComFB family protein [Treponema sp.]|nr:late competence development ComFB family protein [Treponema sp.]
MEIHNITEDVVFNSVQTIIEAVRKEGNPTGLCLCEQCKLDTICFTLNRVPPRYIVSNRGMTRIEQDWVGRQQSEADIATLIYKGLRMVNHNQRPTSSHTEKEEAVIKSINAPAFHIPTIIGRLFDGITFAPLAGVTVELRTGDELVVMRNHNWQNPFTLITNTPGTFTFWPEPVLAEETDVHRTFRYTLKVISPEYETLTHIIDIPTISSLQSSNSSHTMDRTFKLPDLYLFPPGQESKYSFSLL